MFELLIPTFSHSWLNKERVAEYETEFQQGKIPTAVALSVLDIKGPADWEGDLDIVEHLCLAHYLVDGHHKVYAAVRSGCNIKLVSFLALEQGVASQEEIDDFLTRVKQV